jgi:hypothetical protein
VPREHLFEQLGLDRDTAPGTHRIGKGVVLFEQSSPAALSRKPEGAEQVRALTRSACEAIELPYRETNHILLRRGPYVIGAGLDESTPEPPHVLRGAFVDLFDSQLPVLDEVALTPGSRRLLVDLDRIGATRPVVVASACKVLDAHEIAGGGFRFQAEGPEGIDALASVALREAPGQVLIDGQPLSTESRDWDARSKILRVRFPNAASGHRVELLPRAGRDPAGRPAFRPGVPVEATPWDRASRAASTLESPPAGMTNRPRAGRRV